MNMQNASAHIVQWLLDYAKRAGKDTFVVGISGGIDSALVSTLCAKTGLKVRAISMPVHSKRSPLANSHLGWLITNFPNVEVDVSDIGDSFEMEIQEYRHPLDGLQRANLQSRLRMIRLYLYAGSSGLVVGTGNKVEDAGLGFFTKYGDGGVDISPIGDLLKSEVRAMAAYLGIDPRIIEVAPTDGLWEPGSGHETDEQALGMTYDEAEQAMALNDKYEMVKTMLPNHSIDQFIEVEKLTDKQVSLLKNFLGWHNATSHKMNMPPVCIIPENLRD